MRRTIVKKVKGFQFATDPLRQVVVIRTVFVDSTTSDTAIPRGNIREVMEYLARALADFESQSQTKQ